MKSASVLLATLTALAGAGLIRERQSAPAPELPGHICDSFNSRPAASNNISAVPPTSTSAAVPSSVNDSGPSQEPSPSETKKLPFIERPIGGPALYEETEEDKGTFNFCAEEENPKACLAAHCALWQKIREHA
ncbi:hypothetical protein MAJ_11308, partial [Metarhizium majus ARSEF 297]